MVETKNPSARERFNTSVAEAVAKMYYGHEAEGQVGGTRSDVVRILTNPIEMEDLSNTFRSAPGDILNGLDEMMRAPREFVRHTGDTFDNAAHAYPVAAAKSTVKAVRSIISGPIAPLTNVARRFISNVGRDRENMG